METTFVTDKFLAERWGVARKTIWAWARNGTIPKPVKLGPACTRWNLTTIEDHESRLAVA